MKKVLCALLLSVLLTSACGAHPVAFEMRKTPVTAKTATELMRQAKKNPPEAMTAEQYALARTETIDSFVRAAEEAGAEAPSLRAALAAVSPTTSTNHAIPRTVIKAPFGKNEAWIIVQNWGKPGTQLTFVKVWAIGVKDQSLLYAASER